MNEIDTFLEDVQRAVNAEPGQRLYNKENIRSRMKWLDQNKLIEGFNRMNLEELRYCMGCGIPGTANLEAIRLAQDLRKEYNKFLEMQSRRKQHQDQQKDETVSDTVTVSTEDKESWSENNDEKTEGRGISEALHAFKEGRESDR